VANPDPLAGEPFSFLSRADGSIVIHYYAAPVTLLRGKAAARFTTRMVGADAAAAQQQSCLPGRACVVRRVVTGGVTPTRWQLGRASREGYATRFVFLDT